MTKTIKEIFGKLSNEDINLLFRGVSDPDGFSHIESDLISVDDGLQTFSGVVLFSEEDRYFRYVYEYDSWGELETEEDIIDLIEEVFPEEVTIQVFMTKEEKQKYEKEI